MSGDQSWTFHVGDERSNLFAVPALELGWHLERSSWTKEAKVGLGISHGTPPNPWRLPTNLIVLSQGHRKANMADNGHLKPLSYQL